MVYVGQSKKNDLSNIKTVNLEHCGSFLERYNVPGGENTNMVKLDDIKRNIKAGKTPVDKRTGTLSFKVSEFVLGAPGTVFTSSEVSKAMVGHRAPSVRAAVQGLALNSQKTGISRIKYAGCFVYGSITDIKVIEDAYKQKKTAEKRKAEKKVVGDSKLNKNVPKVLDSKKETPK